MKKYSKLWAMFALTISGSASANAIYDNISGINTFQDGIGLSSDGQGYVSYVASEFSTLSLCPNGCTLGNITLNLTSVDSSSLGFTLEVDADNAGTPGQKLMTMKDPSQFSISFGNDTFTPTGTLNLANNTNYWVKFSTTSASTTYWNYLSNAAALGQPSLAHYDLSGFVGSFSAPHLLMKVDASTASTIPVPGAVWMMGTALLGFLTSRYRKAS